MTSGQISLRIFLAGSQTNDAVNNITSKCAYLTTVRRSKRELNVKMEIVNLTLNTQGVSNKLF